MKAGAASSGLVAVLFDGRSALSMTAVMAACSLFALLAYCLLARPAERRIHSQAVEVPAAIEGATHS
jgi:DHA1 family bicyclomycin/chloramphenicol resistance-like MFS transporter